MSCGRSRAVLLLTLPLTSCRHLRRTLEHAAVTRSSKMSISASLDMACSALSSIENPTPRTLLRCVSCHCTFRRSLKGLHLCTSSSFFLYLTASNLHVPLGSNGDRETSFVTGTDSLPRKAGVTLNSSFTSSFELVHALIFEFDFKPCQLLDLI